MASLILGSASPRRAELLQRAGYVFEQYSVAVDETAQPGETATALVERLAQLKATTCLQAYPEAVVLAADTVVEQEDRIYGKPAHFEEFEATMRHLSNAAHTVVSGVCVLSKERMRVFHCTTQIWFGSLTPSWIQRYWETGEPADCAGGYAIQGGAESCVQKIQGSYTNVVGLPVYETGEVLEEFGIQPARMPDASLQ